MRLLLGAVGSLLGIASGCAVEPNYDVPTPVGPPPTAADQRSVLGTLSVYSEWVLSDEDEPDYHANYEIHTADGVLLRAVDNRVGVSEEPAHIDLKPGRYTVVASASGYKRVSVPVVIAEGRTTIVYLDGEKWAAGSKGTSADLVRLPNGMTVGWRASDEVRNR